ncbi:MAG: hypothetical protein AAB071_05110 [Bacteroidota bacterium]
MELTYIFLSVIVILLIVILIRVFKKETKDHNNEFPEINNSVGSLTRNFNVKLQSS